MRNGFPGVLPHGTPPNSFLMSAEEPPDTGPVTDPQELERVMKLAAKDDALHGPFFRLLMEARLWIFVPAHPEMVSHWHEQTEPFTWLVYKDDQGDFAPVFTTERAAEQRAEKLSGKTPMMMELPARVLLAHLHSAQSTMLLGASNGATFRMPPKVLESLVKGHFTEFRPNREPGPKVRLRAVPPENVPAKLRQAIRVFCTKRQGAIAVNVFNPVNPETGQADELDLRVFVRLRDNPGHFYNDFRIMAERATPKPYRLSIGAAREGDKEGMAFFQRCAPVWPVLGRSGTRTDGETDDFSIP